MQQLLIFFHILLAVVIIALVLLQQGKGANMGAAFGSGSTNSVFGSKGPVSFLLKLTLCMLFMFFTTSITLTYMAFKRYHASQHLLKKPDPLALHKDTADLKSKEQHAFKKYIPASHNKDFLKNISKNSHPQNTPEKHK